MAKKIALKFKENPDGIGNHIFDNEKQMQETIKGWEESGKITKVNLKGGTLSYEHHGEKGSAVIREVADDFQFEEESQD